MLDSLIRFALNYRLLVVSIAAALVVYGSLAVKSLPIDVFPDITKPTVTIMTEAHGLAPEEVEARVTLPIESYLNGLPGVERTRSQSGIGLSAIYVEFDWGTDIYRARQLVQEKLSLSKERLPKDINPTIGPVGSLMGQIQQIAITTKSENSVSPIEIRSLAEWVIRPRLMTIPGVSQVIIVGGGLKQYQILVSAEKLNRYQISIEQLDRELAQISQNTTGGFLEKDGFEYLVRNIGIVRDLEDIKKTLVGVHFGRPVLVEDIAEVRIGARLKRGDGSFNGKPSVVLTIQKQPGADTIRITRDIERALQELSPALPSSILIQPDVFKQASFIEASVNGIIGKLQFGTILVFVVLFLFLANLRMSIITLTAIPVSFLFTALVFKLFGLTVNTMTLGGLAIAVGELVDDSIVDVENIYRRLRENAKLPNPRAVLPVIFEASSEVRNSIVLATLIIALVFLPLFNLSGLEGRLFAPLGISYLAALVASLVVSLTLTPVLCSYFLRGDLKGHTDTVLVEWLKGLDRRILNWVFPRSNAVIAIVVLLFILSLGLLPYMGRDFLPKFNEGTAMISLVSLPGTSLTESNRLGVEAEKLILQVAEVKSVSRRTGRAEMDEHAMGVNVSEIDVDFHEGGRKREDVLNEIRNRIKKQLPGIGVNIGQPISHLIDHMLSGVNAAIAIKVFGSDLTTLREKAQEIAAAVRDVDGLVDLRVESQGLIPQIKVHVLREEAARFGLSSGQVTKLLEVAFNGEALAQVIEDTKQFDVFFQFDETSRGSIDKMESTVLKVMPDGRRVLLKDVADVYEANGPNEISRENGQRRIVVSANADNRDLVGLISEIQSRVKNRVQMPEGYYVLYGGQFESQQRATRNVLLFGMLSLLGIALVLYGSFRSKALTAQIMTTIPLAFIGGIGLLFLVDRTITVASLVGFITLCGVAARNGIMMISHYLHLMKCEGEKFGVEMIIRGSQERLVPVIMTALVASLALLPLVFAQGEPGSEVLHPVAVVIVGGLLTSTLLDVIVTPVLFYRFGRRSAERFVVDGGDAKV